MKPAFLTLPGLVRRRRWRWAVPGVASVTLLLASASAATLPATTNALPRVVSVSGPLQLGRLVTIQVAGLKPWIEAGNTPHKLLLFLQGRPSPADYPEAVDRESGVLQYHLAITPDNWDLWDDLLRQPTLTRKVTVSVGPDVDSHFPTSITGQNAATLKIIAFPWGLFSLAVIGLTLASLVYLARHTDLIRDAGPASTPERRKPYSLARTQMAIWFFLIFSAYIVIWLVTGDLNTITQSLLGLMGISAGTALGGAVIDNQKRDAAAGQLARLNPANPEPASAASAPAGTATPVSPLADPARQLQDRLDPGVSQGFLRDILGDGDGLSLHRFQILAWTVALAVIFVSAAYNTLRMPEFSATLLGLMGISAGTYLGFKVPEK
jgi:hypothetical protein